MRLQCVRPRFDLWIGHNPWWRARNTLQYSCLENLHGQRRLASYSTWGHKEWDMTERLSTHPKSGWRAGIYPLYLFDIITYVLSSLISAAFSSSYITFGTETHFLQDLLEGNRSLFVGICIPPEVFNRGTEADKGTSMKEDWGDNHPWK